MNEQVQKMMKALGLTEQEARELLADDAKVDKGQKMDFDLTPEQEKESKKGSRHWHEKAYRVQV